MINLTKRWYWAYKPEHRAYELRCHAYARPIQRLHKRIRACLCGAGLSMRAGG